MYTPEDGEHLDIVLNNLRRFLLRRTLQVARLGNMMCGISLSLKMFRSQSTFRPDVFARAEVNLPRKGANLVTVVPVCSLMDFMDLVDLERAGDEFNGSTHYYSQHDMVFLFGAISVHPPVAAQGRVRLLEEELQGQAF